MGIVRAREKTGRERGLRPPLYLSRTRVGTPHASYRHAVSRKASDPSSSVGITRASWLPCAKGVLALSPHESAEHSRSFLAPRVRQLRVPRFLSLKARSRLPLLCASRRSREIRLIRRGLRSLTLCVLTLIAQPLALPNGPPFFSESGAITVPAYATRSLTYESAYCRPFQRVIEWQTRENYGSRPWSPLWPLIRYPR